MYIITDQKNVVVYLSSDISYQTNGNPLVDSGSLAIGFPCHVSGDVTVPSEVRVRKYLYQDGKFSVNPDYKVPQPTAEEQLRADVDYLAAMQGVQL